MESYLVWVKTHILPPILRTIGEFPFVNEHVNLWIKRKCYPHRRYINNIIKRNIHDEAIKNIVYGVTFQYAQVFKVTDVAEFLEKWLEVEGVCILQACISSIMRRYNIKMRDKNGRKYNNKMLIGGKWIVKKSKYAHEPSFFDLRPVVVNEPLSDECRAIRADILNLGVHKFKHPHPRYRKTFNKLIVNMPYIVTCPAPRYNIVSINDVIINEMFIRKIRNYQDRFDWAYRFLYQLNDEIKIETRSFTRVFLEKHMKMDVTADIFDSIKRIPWYEFVSNSTVYPHKYEDGPEQEFLDMMEVVEWTRYFVFKGIRAIHGKYTRYFYEDPLDLCFYDLSYVNHAYENIRRIIAAKPDDEFVNKIIYSTIARFAWIMQYYTKEMQYNNTEDDEIDYIHYEICRDVLLGDLPYLCILEIMYALKLDVSQDYQDGFVSDMGYVLRDGKFYADEVFDSDHKRLTHMGLPLVYKDNENIADKINEPNIARPGICHGMKSLCGTTYFNLLYATLRTYPLSDIAQIEDIVIREMYEKGIMKIRDRIRYIIDFVKKVDGSADHIKYNCFTPNNMRKIGVELPENCTISGVLDFLDLQSPLDWVKYICYGGNSYSSLYGESAEIIEEIKNMGKLFD